MHTHCSLDPMDYRFCRYSPEELLRETARHGYEVLAITCHDLDVWSRDLCEYAASLGVTLIPGMEVTAEKTRHVLLYNFGVGAEDLDTLAKIRNRSRPDTLVVAPHPFYPTNRCLQRLLADNMDLFDAIETSGFFAPGLDFNRRARGIAERQGKPLVGNGDVHLIWQLGRTYTWIYAEPNLHSILDAVKQGRIRVESSSLSYRELAKWWATAFWSATLPGRMKIGRDRRRFGRRIVETLSNQVKNG